MIDSFKKVLSLCHTGMKFVNLMCITSRFGIGHVIYCRILVSDLTSHLMRNVCSNIMARSLFVLLMSLGWLMPSGTFKYVVWCMFFRTDVLKMMLQSQLPMDRKLLAFILYADKAKLSTFGSQKGYLVIVRLANLPTSMQNGESFAGGRVVGWCCGLASPKPNFRVSTPIWT